MAAPAFEHADEARAALRAIVSDPAHGPAALDNPQTTANLLQDYLPDAPREAGLLPRLPALAFRLPCAATPGWAWTLVPRSAWPPRPWPRGQRSRQTPANGHLPSWRSRSA